MLFLDTSLRRWLSTGVQYDTYYQASNLRLMTTGGPYKRCHYSIITCKPLVKKRRISEKKIWLKQKAKWSWNTPWDQINIADWFIRFRVYSIFVDLALLGAQQTVKSTSITWLSYTRYIDKRWILWLSNHITRVQYRWIINKIITIPGFSHHNFICGLNIAKFWSVGVWLVACH